MTNAFSAMAMGFSISGLAGPLVAGVVIDHAGHRFAFLLLCVSTVASLLLLRHARRRYPPEPTPRAEQARARVADLLQHPPLRKVLAASALISMGWDLFAFLAPLQGVRAGLSATATGVVVGIFGAGTFAIRLMLPWVARRFGEWGAIRGALFVTALGYLAFPLLDSFAALLAAAFLLGMALGGGQPVSMSLLHMAAPAGRAGEAVGVRSAITAASQTLLPLVFGALGNAVGLGVVFWAVAGVLAAGGFATSRQR
jgi:predicted MFS family arabinose efflux permease